LLTVKYMSDTVFRFLLMTNLLLIPMISGADPSAVATGRKACVEAKGIFVLQEGKIACFDPRRGVVNDQYSPASGHYKPEKEDFDLLTLQPMYFMRRFSEFGELTVCNYTVGQIWVDGGSAMRLLRDNKTPPELVKDMETAVGTCRQPSGHMFAIYPDLKTAQMAVGLCATPSGRPYYDQKKYEDDYFKSQEPAPSETSDTPSVAR
jgi:hypothetical protein